MSQPNSQHRVMIEIRGELRCPEHQLGGQHGLELRKAKKPERFFVSLLLRFGLLSVRRFFLRSVLVRLRGLERRRSKSDERRQSQSAADETRLLERRSPPTA